MKTTLHTVLCVAIRLGAVLMAAGIFEQLLSLVLLSIQEGHAAWAALSLQGAGLLVALALWLWPNLLAWWALGRNQHELMELTISPARLQYVAMSVVGVWMFIGGLSGVAGHGVMIVFINQEATVGNASGMVPTGEWHWMVYYTTMLLAGGGLTLGARGLAGLLQRLRGYQSSSTPAVSADDASFAQDG